MTEHRIIGYRKVTDKTKYNSRTAELNAEQQAAQHQAQVAVNQATGQTIGTGMEMADKVPTSQALQNAQTVYNAPGTVTHTDGVTSRTDPRNPTGYVAPGARVGNDRQMFPEGWQDPNSVVTEVAGGTLPPDMVAAQKAAIMAQNTELLKQQQIQQENAERMAKNAAAGSAAAQGNATQDGVVNPLSEKTYTGAAGERLQKRLDAGSATNTPADRQEYIQRRRDEGATDPKIREEIDTLPPEQTGGVPKPSESPTTGTGTKTTPETSKTTPKGEETPTGQTEGQMNPRLARISTMLDGIIAATEDPLGPVYKEQIMQEYEDMEEAKANAKLSYDASIERAEDQNDDVQDLMDKYVDLHRKNNDKYTEILRETRDSTQSYVEEQKQRDLERLSWEQNSETRKLSRQKTQQLLSQSIQNALSGSSFSGAANEHLAQTEKEWDIAISNLAQEYSFKKADVSAFYTQKYIDANNQFNLEVFNAAKELDSKIEGYAIQGFNSLQAEKNAKTEAANEYRKALDDANKTYSTNLKGHIKEMQTIITTEKATKLALDTQKKNDAFQFFNFAFTSSTDPALRQAAVDQMKSAGYSLPDTIDMNADPVSFQLATMNNAAKAVASSTNDPFRFTGEGAAEKQALAASALTVVGQLEGGVELNKAQMSYVNQLLDRGQIDEARQHLRGLAVASLKSTQETAYSDRASIVGASTSLVKDLKSIQNTSKEQTLLGGLKEAFSFIDDKAMSDLDADDFTAYKKVIENLKNKMGYSKDPALQRIFAQVENIAGLIINERYGAAVTDGELARAREYIAMSGNTLSDMIIKLEEFSRFSKFQNEVMLNTKMGLPSTDIDMSAPDINSTPDIPSDDVFNEMFTMGAPKTSGVTERDLVTFNVAGRAIKAQRYVASAIQQADAEFFAATGKHIEINQHYRDSAMQAKLYKDLSAKGARVAPPGKSFHEKGLAIDVSNWKEAQPYLKKFGLVNGLKGDMGHFSLGEMNPEFLTHFKGDGHNHTS